MEYTDKNNAYQNIVNNIFCTEKGKEILDIDEYALGKRERQFLLLLTNDDDVSYQLLIGLAPKVSIGMMLEEGYIDCRVDKEEFLQHLHESDECHKREKSQAKTVAKKTSQPMNKTFTDGIIPSPSVMVAAGVFI